MNIHDKFISLKSAYIKAIKSYESDMPACSTHDISEIMMT